MVIQKITCTVKGQADLNAGYTGGTPIHHYAYTNMLHLKTKQTTGQNVAQKLLSEKRSDRTPASFDEYGAARMDTTGDTLSFLMYNLSLPANHEYQERVRMSLPELPPFGQPLTLAEISQLLNNPYLNSVIKETLLIYPAIPVTLPRVVPHGGRVIDEFRLPAGTLASSSVYAVNQSLLQDFEKIPETDQWKPSRWLVESDADKDEVQELERRLWSFGSGGRGCIGKHLAIVEISLLLAAVLSRFWLRPAENNPIAVTHEQWTARRSFRDIAYMDGFGGIVRFEPLKQ
ncbi:hypothetical protein H072_3681 [Dactylellina haptotyla CBS 200.50]|uniref:Cytochrome P450 n=1 Tax=Dactylellina haptotyla (strain CBS 200.50) TaxID=1284197 RepID=S8AH68_DACHA|nr:hypothetical protein H072_3681 [Dactylellina haptotyla CBS 200.50]